jgi:hypothetical protein
MRIEEDHSWGDRMINCPHCNSELPDKAKFCIYCGNKILDSPQPQTTVPKPSDDPDDKMDILKQKLSSFKAKKEEQGFVRPPDEKAGVYSTQGYKPQYTIERGTYNNPVSDDMTYQDVTKDETPQKVVMKPTGAAPAGLIELKAGHCYLIEENKPKFCFDVFSHYVEENFIGLCISRVNPKRIREDHRIKEEATLLWLTDSKTAGEDSIEPSLERITYDIKAFIGKNKENSTPLIVFDGLEYLLSNNQFNPVIRFLRHLIDECSVSDSVMLIPLSPLAISQQELKMLEREFDVVDREKS